MQNQNDNISATGTFIFAIIAAAGAIALSLFGLHQIGAQERRGRNAAENLAARVQRAMGRNNDAEHTNANRMFNNIAAGAEKVGQTAKECAASAATFTGACIEKAKKL